MTNIRANKDYIIMFLIFSFFRPPLACICFLASSFSLVDQNSCSLHLFDLLYLRLIALWHFLTSSFIAFIVPVSRLPSIITEAVNSLNFSWCTYYLSFCFSTAHNSVLCSLFCCNYHTLIIILIYCITHIIIYWTFTYCSI